MKVRMAHFELIESQTAFQMRAYKELLEECSRIMGRKFNYKTMYTLDGQQIETLTDLRKHCEEEPCPKRRVTIKLSKMISKFSNTKDNSVSDAQSNQSGRKLRNGVSFIIGKSLPRADSQLSNLPDISNHVLNHDSTLAMLDIRAKQSDNPKSLLKDIESLHEQSQMAQWLPSFDSKDPRVILLSTDKSHFRGIKGVKPASPNSKRRQKSESVKEAIETLKAAKTSEFHLDWLERTHTIIDPLNFRATLHQDESIFIHQNDDYRTESFKRNFGHSKRSLPSHLPTHRNNLDSGMLTPISERASRLMIQGEFNLPGQLNEQSTNTLYDPLSS